MTRLTVSLVDGTVEQLEDSARTALTGGADLVELRVDYLDAIDVPALGGILDHLGPARTILTCRAASEGGKYVGSETDRIELLARLATGRDCLVDVEFAAWRGSELLRGKITKAMGGNLSRLILSAHDFNGRPSDPAALLQRIHQANPGGIAKIAWQPADARDNLDAFELMGTGGGRSIVVCMGQQGLASRVLPGKFGAYLTYCSLQQGGEAAPGQIDLDQIERVYRWHHIGSDTRLFGVVGWPLAHSLSPAIHNAAFTELGIDAVYLPLPISPTHHALADLVHRARRCDMLNLSGLSVTIPHKPHALRLADQDEPLTRRIGAANTLIFDTGSGNGVIRAMNTDYAAAMAALLTGLKCRPEDLASRRCAVLGAGGAARAIVAGLLDRRCDVVICNRTAAKARALADEFGCRWQPFDQRGSLRADIVINTTSLGMSPNVDQSPLPAEALRADMVIFDTVYNPLETLLLRQARQAGCHTISGLEMFVRQAALQFEAWTGRPAPLDLMRDVVVRRLRSR